MKPTKHFLALLTMLAVISLACNFITGAGQSPASPTSIPLPDIQIPTIQVPTLPALDIPPTQTQVEDPSGSQPTATEAAGQKSPGGSTSPDLAISGVTDSLAALDSYRAVVVLSYSGMDANNQAQSATSNVLQEFIRASGDTRLKIDSTNTTVTPQTGSFELITVDGVSYLNSVMDGITQCHSFSGGEMPTENPLTSEDIFGALNNLKLVQKGEEVNGILSDQYAFDENSFPTKDFTSAKGSVWLAQDGDYVVKMIGSGEGELQYPLQGNGVTTWDYQLQEVNKLTRIALPEACSASSQPSDIPIPDNATNKSTFDTLTTFESPDSPADVAKFYADALLAAGWTETSKTEMAGLYLLSYSKDGFDLTLTITAAPSGSGSSVMAIKTPK